MVLHLGRLRSVGKGIEANPQALGQSSTFLNTNLPLAAESLIAPISFGERAAGMGAKAAICSKSVVGIYDELEVLYEGTQDRSGMSLFPLPLPPIY
jgi:hypothetical protein